MKKLLLTFAALLCIGLATATIINFKQENINENATTEYVYICTGEYSKKYHRSSSCYGLQNCGGEIKIVTIEEAERLGRTPCKICFHY